MRTPKNKQIPWWHWPRPQQQQQQLWPRRRCWRLHLKALKSQAELTKKRGNNKKSRQSDNHCFDALRLMLHFLLLMQRCFLRRSLWYVWSCNKRSRGCSFFYQAAPVWKMREQPVRHFRQLMQHQHRYNNKNSNECAEKSKIINIKFNHKNSCNI